MIKYFCDICEKEVPTKPSNSIFEHHFVDHSSKEKIIRVKTSVTVDGKTNIISICSDCIRTVVTNGILVVK